jgi:uncharacterized protein
VNRAPAEIPSPCVQICTVDPERATCIGCYRTLDEIAGWPDFTPAQKLAVWERIAQRRRIWDYGAADLRDLAGAGESE